MRIQPVVAGLVLTLNMVLSANLAVAGEKLVYMHEGESGKQIVLKDLASGATRMLTSGRNWHLYPEISADGRKVAFVEGPDSKSLSVVLKDLSTGSATRLTRPGAYLHPSFSGDGKWLAFSGPLGPNGSERIGVLSLKSDGSSLQPHVIRGADRAYFPSLSSDGGFVIFQQTRADGSKDIVEADLRNGAMKSITSPAGISMSPDLSFDDRYVTYTSRRDGNWDVYLFDRQTGRETRITTDPSEDFAPSFSHEGDIVFASNRSGRFALYRIRIQDSRPTGEAVLIASDASGDLYAPSLSGDLAWSQSKKHEMLPPARSSFGAVTHKGRIYVAGGHQGPEHTYPPESFVGTLEYYDIATGAWSKGASRQVPSHGFDIVAHGDYLYAFGGFAYSEDHLPKWKSLDVIERYSIERDTWEVIGKMPRARSSHVVAQIGNQVYLIGGWDSTPQGPNDREGRFHRAIDVFDLESETMVESPFQLPDPLRRAFTAVVKEDKILLLGGLGEGATHFELLGNVTEFNPATGEWKELPQLPFPTFAPAAGVLGDEVLIFGGMFKTGERAYEYVNHVFALSDRWYHTGRYLNETKGFAMVVDMDANQLGILGGHTYLGGQDTPVATFEIFKK